MKEKSDRSKNTWNLRKYVMTVKDFFFRVQSEALKLNPDNYFPKKFSGRASIFTFTLDILSRCGTSSGSNR